MLSLPVEDKESDTHPVTEETKSAVYWGSTGPYRRGLYATATHLKATWTFLIPICGTYSTQQQAYEAQRLSLGHPLLKLWSFLEFTGAFVGELEAYF